MAHKMHKKLKSNTCRTSHFLVHFKSHPPPFYFSVEGFHSDLSIDDRSTLDPSYTTESSVTSLAMSDEMTDDDWNGSDLELESEAVRSEELEVANSERSVGRGRARGRGQVGRGASLVFSETRTSADPDNAEAGVRLSS